MQNYARSHHVAIDELTLDFQVLETTNAVKAPEEGVIVNGLYLEGARWSKEKKSLAESHPKILHDLMPAVKI